MIFFATYHNKIQAAQTARPLMLHFKSKLVSTFLSFANVGIIARTDHSPVLAD
jgi:hypothetical protein